MLDDIRTQVITHSIGIPAGTTQETLDAMRRRFADSLGQLPGILAFDAAHEPAEITLGPDPEVLPPEPRLKPRE